MQNNLIVNDIFVELDEVNHTLSSLSAQERIEFALCNLPGSYALSSSFGAQSAVSLHLLTQIYPNIPVLVADTGYLFPETYQFIDELEKKLKLNLVVVRSKESPAWQETKYGKLWEQGQKGMNEYNIRNKVEPIDAALSELDVATWFAGVRADQSEHRKQLPFIQKFKGRYKVHPILDWSNKNLHEYLNKHQLPYHPLWEQGYISIGDTHSTRSVHEVTDIEELRFGGLNRECGLHVEHPEYTESAA